MHEAIDGLPAIFATLLPGLAVVAWPAEQRADCGACTMVAPPGVPDDRGWFSADVRCCSFHPDLPNFLLGRVLLRGGEGERQVMARLADGGGVDWSGISATEAWRRRYAERRATGFGRDVGLRCPYWVGGDRACGMWADRGATCRTWYCRHEDGPSGRALWRALRSVLACVERAAAAWCVGQGTPDSVPTDAAGWADWYRTCASRVEAVRPEDVDTAEVQSLWAAVLAADEARRRPMPDVLTAAVGLVVDGGDRVWLAGEASHDRIAVPRDVFTFLSRLDGSTPWRDALEAARGDGVAWLDEAGVRQLWRRGVLVQTEERGGST